MTNEEKIHAVEELACRAQEDGAVLSPVTVLAVLQGRVQVSGKVRPLSHDLPDYRVGGTAG